MEYPNFCSTIYLIKMGYLEQIGGIILKNMQCCKGTLPRVPTFFVWLNNATEGAGISSVQHAKSSGRVFSQETRLRSQMEVEVRLGDLNSPIGSLELRQIYVNMLERVKKLGHIMHSSDVKDWNKQMILIFSLYILIIIQLIWFCILS